MSIPTKGQSPESEQGNGATFERDEFLERTRGLARQLKTPAARKHFENFLSALLDLGRKHCGHIVLRMHGGEACAFELRRPSAWGGPDAVEALAKERSKGEGNTLLLDLSVDPDLFERASQIAVDPEDLIVLSQMRVRGHLAVLDDLPEIFAARRK